MYTSPALHCAENQSVTSWRVQRLSASSPRSQFGLWKEAVHRRFGNFCILLWLHARHTAGTNDFAVSRIDIGTPPSIKTRPEVSNATRSPPLDFSPFTAASKSFVSLAESCSQGWWNQACTIHTHSKHEKTGNGMSKEKCDTKKNARLHPANESPAKRG